MFIWKLYFVFYALLTVGSYCSPETYTSFSLPEYLDILPDIILLAGVFCFTWQIKLLSRTFWRNALVFSLIWSVIYTAFFSGTYFDTLNIPLPSAIFISILSFGIVIPAYYGVYKLYKDWDNISK